MCIDSRPPASPRPEASIAAPSFGFGRCAGGEGRKRERRSLWPGLAPALVAGLLTAAGVGACDAAAALNPGEGDGQRSTLVVEIAPDSSEISIGDSLDLTASVEDTTGSTVSRSVSWSSSDTSVATVEDGRVTGRAEGTAEVRAEVDAAADTAVVSVTSGPSDGSGSVSVDECSSPDSAWIWCDDFEQDRLSSYFEYNEADGSFVRAQEVGLEGSAGMRGRFDQGQVSAGWLHLAIGQTPDSYMDPVDDGTQKYRDIYWRLYVRNEDQWTGGGGEKLTRAWILATADWDKAMMAHVWSGGTDEEHLVIDPASGTDQQGNLVADTRWLGYEATETPIFAAEHIGQWHCVEARVRLNEAGRSDGVFRLWIDGQLEAEREGLNWVGSYDEYGVNVVKISNYWNDGSPAQQERYIDNFVVSTERIGC